MTLAVEVLLFSSAHCWIPPSICRKLLMQAFCCEVVRALMKLGMAIAANSPIMATTIMISTNVNPDLRDDLIFILSFLPFFSGGVNLAAGGLVLLQFCSLIACCNRALILPRKHSDRQLRPIRNFCRDYHSDSSATTPKQIPSPIMSPRSRARAHPLCRSPRPAFQP